MKYAILSTDNNPEYYQLLPLVCYSWRKIGFEPIVITVGLPYEVMEQIEKFTLAHMIRADQIVGVKDSTIAQVSRLFVGHKPQPDDILITADADMVIASDIFTHDVSQGQIVSYGYDLTGRSELPICYVKATAAKWRELMGEFTIPEKAYSERWEDYWSVDQRLLTQRAQQYGIGRITFVDRGNQNKHGLPTGRWDRFDWGHIPDSIIDVHMKRNDWDAQIEVFQKLWPGEDHSFITKFKDALEGQHTKVDVIMGEDAKLKGTWQGLYDKYAIETGRININDEWGFLETTGNWDNHKPLLLLALSLTNGKVTELGAGEGSTLLLRAYCKEAGRQFESYDSDYNWALKMGSGHVWDWDAPARWHDIWQPCGLLFVDHAPGEHRKVAIERMMDKAQIICVHDTEIGGAGDYGFEPVFAKFRYRLNYNKSGGGAGATLVSNIIDVNRFRGLSLGPYTFDND